MSTDRQPIAALVERWRTVGIANLDVRSPREVQDICAAQLEAAIAAQVALWETGMLSYKGHIFENQRIATRRCIADLQGKEGPDTR